MNRINNEKEKIQQIECQYCGVLVNVNEKICPECRKPLHQSNNEIRDFKTAIEINGYKNNEEKPSEHIPEKRIVFNMKISLSRHKMIFLLASLIIILTAIFTIVIISNDSLKKAEKLFLKGDFDPAFKIFSELADNGNSRAMYYLGEYYTHGIGSTHIDNEKASEWREKGAETGDILAKLNIAVSLPEDSELKKDILNNLFPSVLEMAENGNARAQSELAGLYEHGWGIQQDLEKARIWYEKAIEKGDIIATHNLGRLYFKGSNEIKENRDKAYNLILTSSEKGFPGAWFNLGSFYKDGFNVKPDQQEAFKWFLKAAEQGHAIAQNYVAFYSKDGVGTKQNKIKAFEWYKKSAEQGLHAAQYGLANAYFYGEGIAKDKSEAFKWYMKSARQDFHLAQYRVGECYYNGDGVEEDKTLAFNWYKQAAEHNNLKAMIRIGECYLRGDCTQMNENEAFKWFMKAAEPENQNGDPEAQYLVGISYDKGIGVAADKQKAFEWLKKSSDQGYLKAQILTALCYENGIGITADKTEAFKLWLNTAIRKHNPFAQYKLACRFHEQGKHEEAKKWLRNAAAQGNKEAKESLFKWYKETTWRDSADDELYQMHLKLSE